MKSCTFFGHRDCPKTVMPLLQKAIAASVAEGVAEFYVGNHGNFDAMALTCLRQWAAKQPHVRYTVVLAYLPTDDLPDPTLLPEGIEAVPRRFAVTYRNRWMIDHSDGVIAYVKRTYGGAAAAVRRAERQGKRVIRL